MAPIVGQLRTRCAFRHLLIEINERTRPTSGRFQMRPITREKKKKKPFAFSVSRQQGSASKWTKSHVINLNLEQRGARQLKRPHAAAATEGTADVRCIDDPHLKMAVKPARKWKDRRERQDVELHRWFLFLEVPATPKFAIS